MASPLAGLTTNNNVNGSGSPDDSVGLVAAFRQKAQFMKNWKPTSAPSNRDRLELYAWHKQAVSGDAPLNMPNTNSMNMAEKAKYTSWKAKAGTDVVTAMRSYMFESDRQVRVYGVGAPAALAVESSNDRSTDSAAESASNNTSTTTTTSRGLAAIPLLCAAASEQRAAYLRRLQSTPTAWWRRQEPLTAAPGSLAALPESALLALAAGLERLSLAANSTTVVMGTPIPQVACAVVQSGLWPLHNALLAVWMGYILVASVLSAAVELSKTVLLGSRRTGRTLDSIWSDDVLFLKGSCDTLTESHQPVSARVIGLLTWPLPVAVALVCGLVPHNHALSQACLYVAFTIVTAWYWVALLPWMFVVCILGSALLLGNCFALIELAGHI